MKLAKNIKNIAKKVLLNEAKALEKLADYIDEDFEGCVEEILQCKGRVVITGVGKSAIIANKIVATLNSTGTPSLFMHAADAIHGDLGMVQKDDVAICISKSGNTPEIKVLVPLIKRTGVKLVALVSDVSSFLAKQADFVLNATIEEEACTNNLAPTTSTTAHLAIGDALAVSLLECRGFTNEDFAKYHPGGALGKQLYLKVNDIYPNHELPVVNTEDSVKDIIIEISSKRLGAAAVLDESRKLVGIITDGDLRRMLENYSDLTSICARDVMTTDPKTIEKDTYAVRALNVMQQNNIAQLIVKEGDKVLGFVHLHDILKEGIV
ncbi:KpsF/GutQ family sugar-phosphate isomerase [Fulvivirgaceae bacterium BMA10]|uniref:KpsF/GutQ family sugar-phosphate isomerase n=1 Tax=Splendidivirga corallicola TaxID=3051826 RepID=A0ABT8KZW4_9BACT|nr:KpsF/GutQ family sugar-phosphate isomerase [Fulvivirgaceae bacterium BMA10]